MYSVLVDEEGLSSFRRSSHVLSKTAPCVRLTQQTCAIWLGTSLDFIQKEPISSN